MATPTRVAVACELVSHDHGHWCNQCLLSTAVRAHLTVTVAGQVDLHTVMWCPECGIWDIAPTDDPSSCS